MFTKRTSLHRFYFPCCHFNLCFPFLQIIVAFSESQEGTTETIFIPQCLTTTDLFTISIVLPFPECRRVWNHSVAFADWLLSLSNMPLRFLHVFSWLNGSFIFSEIKFHCLDGPQYIYPFNYRRVSWLLTSVGNYEYSCYIPLCARLCVDINFQLLWIIVREHDCWII